MSEMVSDRIRNERQKAQETAEGKNMEDQSTGTDKFIQSWGTVEIKCINT